MGKIFPTKHEMAAVYGRWALGLSLAGIVLWTTCYINGIIVIYGFICPPMLAGAVWCGCKMVGNRRSGPGWLLLGFSVLCLAVSLLPWFLPIATV